MATHSTTLAWKIPWTEEPGRLQSMGSLESDTTKRLHFHFSLSCIGEGNGNPLQCSCLENPRDGGAWWAAIYGVAQSRTQLKRLSSSSSSRASSQAETGLKFSVTEGKVKAVLARNDTEIVLEGDLENYAHSSFFSLGGFTLFLPSLCKTNCILFCIKQLFLGIQCF